MPSGLPMPHQSFFQSLRSPEDDQEEEDDKLEQQAAAEAAEVARYGPRLYGSRYFPHGPQVVVEEAADDPE